MTQDLSNIKLSLDNLNTNDFSNNGRVDNGGAHKFNLVNLDNNIINKLSGSASSVESNTASRRLFISERGIGSEPSDTDTDVDSDSDNVQSSPTHYEMEYNTKVRRNAVNDNKKTTRRFSKKIGKVGAGAERVGVEGAGVGSEDVDDSIHYKKLSYNNVRRQINKSYEQDIIHRYSSALDILASY